MLWKGLVLQFHLIWKSSVTQSDSDQEWIRQTQTYSTQHFRDIAVWLFEGLLQFNFCFNHIEILKLKLHSILKAFERLIDFSCCSFSMQDTSNIVKIERDFENTWRKNVLLFKHSFVTSQSVESTIHFLLVDMFIVEIFNLTTFCQPIYR